MASKPLFLFCDANTAVYDTHLFKKRGGPDVVRLLRSLQARLVIPDISRSEYLNNYAKVSASVREKAEEFLSQLQTLSGQPVSGALPPERFWVTSGPQILEDLREITFEIVATAELKAAALDRSVEGRKPATKPNQDIKDCLIWECILSLPPGSEVLFASRDMKAFYHDGKFDERLLNEAAAKDVLITPVDTKAENLNAAVELLKERLAAAKALQVNDLRLDEEPAEPDERAAVGDFGPVTGPVLPGDNNQNAPDAPVEAENLQINFDIVAPARDFFRPLEEKALGFVSYLGRSGKQEAIELLSQSGATVDAARNVLERLALAGMIRDTGNNYLRVEGIYANRASELVEGEMIKLTGLGG